MAIANIAFRTVRWFVVVAVSGGQVTTVAHRSWYSSTALPEQRHPGQGCRRRPNSPPGGR
ncbi:hypothetical protein [Micromonospora sp. NBC_00858]|uniref:hypothetical protein n=1 Tax=Micromonospora sp. NBC_00858 TaxID=2975979 RepID=UPI00386C226A|nr:hypothetical protein OG990_16685 [Micromonospora sp. NBC_00858]